MSHIVLARKLRPTRFSALVGQEIVARALRNAVHQKRVAHAFLFTGPRGVGKTSAARILTRAINCEAPVEGEPCEECGRCEEIGRGASADVHEIDAASNRGIDHIRELRENARFTPTRLPYKVYIIDEAHMLTMESCNALLKILEEPPGHVKFILATTEAQRLPETIISRCQRFDFPRIPRADIEDCLERVAQEEQITLSPGARAIIARRACGGLRDALTALEQGVSFAGAVLDETQVNRALGLVSSTAVLDLLNALCARALPEALQRFHELDTQGEDLHALLVQLIEAVQGFAMYQALRGHQSLKETLPLREGETPPSGQKEAVATDEELSFRERWEKKITLDTLQQWFYLLLELEEQLRRSEYARSCFEMSLVKICRVQPLTGVAELLAQAERLLQGAPAGLPPQLPAETFTGSTVPALAHKVQAMHDPVLPPQPTPPTQNPAPTQTAAPKASTQTKPASSADPAPAVKTETETEAESEAETNIPLCATSRWREIARLCYQHSPSVGSRLRQSEPLLLEAQRVELLVSPETAEHDTWSQVKRVCQEACGKELQLHIREGEPEPARTLVGYQKHTQRVRKEQHEQNLVGHPAIKKTLDLFPQAKVLKVVSNEVDPKAKEANADSLPSQETEE